MRMLASAAALALAACHTPDISAAPPLDTTVASVLAETGAQGIAVAVIKDGKVASARAWGLRNATGEPLLPDTVMYGASITKTVFAYTVLQLVDEGILDLDRSIADYLPQPLPSYTDADTIDRYADYSALDDRWRKLTPRILLSHSSGFANFGFLEPDQKLKFHWDPGARYGYSGDGLILLQFVLEKGLGRSVLEDTQKRVFDRFGMPNTSLMWRADFASNLADGWREDGSVELHDERSAPRAAGSMDTTIADLSKFAAALVRGEGLSPASHRAMLTPQLPITTATQFPTLQPELPPRERFQRLWSGLGVILFDGPQGKGFMKGGHNDSTGNMLVCLEIGQRCVVILSNDVRTERGFARIVRAVLGEAGVPWDWEYSADFVLP